MYVYYKPSEPFYVFTKFGQDYLDGDPIWDYVDEETTHFDAVLLDADQVCKHLILKSNLPPLCTLS